MLPLQKNATWADFWGHLTSALHSTPQALDWCPSMMVADEPYATYLLPWFKHLDPESFSLIYCSVDGTYAIVNSLGTGAFMSKNVFCLMPIHPND